MGRISEVINWKALRTVPGSPLGGPGHQVTTPGFPGADTVLSLRAWLERSEWLQGAGTGTDNSYEIGDISSIIVPKSTYTAIALP